MFAVSFAFISVVVGIFGTYDDVLQSSGPVGIWLWVLVAGGQFLVVLVFVEFVARISLSGSSYQWASRLANPKIGWMFGWLTVWYLAIGPDLIVVGLIVVGGVYFLGMLIFNPGVLETEPGNAEPLEARERVLE